LFNLIKNRLGEELAYEVMTYVALHPEYSRAAIETGYNETIAALRKKKEISFRQLKSVEYSEDEEE